MFQQAEMSVRWDAIVIGAGVVGLGAARALLSEGLKRVLVLERHVVGGGASSRGTGSVHTQRWTETDVRLIQRTRQLMDEIAASVGPAFEFNTVGRVTLAPEADAERLREFAAMFRGCGVDVQCLSRPELLRLIPGINAEDVGLATYTRADGCVYPGALTWALAGVVRREGALVMEGVDARAIVFDGDQVKGVEVGFPDPIVLEAPRVIVAAGAWTGLLLAKAKLPIPLQQISTTTVVAMVADAAGCSPIPSFLDAVQGGYSYIPRNPGTIVLAGGATDDPVPGGEERTDATPPPFTDERQAGIFDELYRCASHRFPGWTLGPVLGGWSGMLDTTPDSNPIAGNYPGKNGLWLACGLSGYGVMRGMALGEAVAHQSLDRPPLVDTSPYAPDRFGALNVPFSVKWEGYNPFSSLKAAE